MARRSSRKISFTISLSSTLSGRAAMSGFGDFRIACCRLGIRQNRPERLVNFMSDGGGQFASGREAVDMGKFRHALPGLHFGKLTPTMLT